MPLIRRKSAEFVLKSFSKEDKEVASWINTGFFNSTSPGGTHELKLSRGKWHRPIHAIKDKSRLSISSSAYEGKDSPPEAVEADQQKLDWAVTMSDKATECLKKLNSWDFDIFELTEITAGRPLTVLGWHLFETTSLFSKYGIPRNIFLNAFSAIEGGYLDVPYHNRIHAAGKFIISSR